MSWRSEGRVFQAAGPQKEQKEPIRRHDAQLSSSVGGVNWTLRGGLAVTERHATQSLN